MAAHSAMLVLVEGLGRLDGAIDGGVLGIPGRLGGRAGARYEEQESEECGQRQNRSAQMHQQHLPPGQDVFGCDMCARRP
jgi:hypothetical protein